MKGASSAAATLDKSVSASLQAPGEGARTAGVAAEPQHISVCRPLSDEPSALPRLLDDLIVAYKNVSRLQGSLQTTWSVDDLAACWCCPGRFSGEPLQVPAIIPGRSNGHPSIQRSPGSCAEAHDMRRFVRCMITLD